MAYEELVKVYDKIDATSSRLEKTDIIADFLNSINKTNPEEIYNITLLLMGKVFPPWSDKELGVGTQIIIKAISEVITEKPSVIETKLGSVGDLGEITESLLKNKTQTSFFTNKLTVNKVYSNLRKIETITGKKSQNKKINLILELYVSASAKEAKYITRTITEQLRIGVGEGTVVDAIAKAYDVNKKSVEKALMLSNDLGYVADKARISEDELKKITLTPGKPVKPMLAQLSEGIKETVSELKEVICETKYDGIRVQIHNKNGKINIFTRRLENVTNALPEVVTYLEKALNIENYIVEGEVIATKDGQPISFQYILQRVKRKHNIEEMVKKIPLKVFLFDVLYYEGQTVDQPIYKRRELLEELVTTSKNVELSTMKKVSCSNIEEAEKLFEWSINNGHEGIMLKDMYGEYKPGNRGKKMLKYKPVQESLDCIITGGIYGKGKRAKFFGSYLVSLQDDVGNYVTLAHAATGMNDQLLESLTKRMEKLVISRKGREVKFKPEVILEISYSEIVESNEYESGYSLRFPVVKRVRDDISGSDVDTLSKLKSIIELSKK
ncbi:MAG: ATP-dependent DNA ligase [Methanobacteriaceae archaeon]|nr:ATP-dependent DNA ligase [Methanobacteriaceae archaeon]